MKEPDSQRSPGAASDRPPGIRSELSALARLAFPVALNQSGLALLGIVDTAVVGRVGAGPLAAVGLANGIFFAFSVIGIGLMLGLDPFMSQSLGAGDPVRARQFAWQGVWLAFPTALALAIPMLSLPWALVPLGIEPAIAADVRSFLALRLLGVPALLICVAWSSYLQASGRVRSVIWAVVAANVVNFGLDLLFVFGGASLPGWTGPLRALPPMRAAGAALSSSISLCAQLAVLAWAVRRVELKGRPTGVRRLLPLFVARVARVGIPIGLQMCAEVGVFALAGLLAGRLGRERLAAHQIALTLASFTFTAAVGVGSAGSVRVGRAIGALDSAGARRAGLAAFATGAGFMALTALVFFFVPNLLAQMMTSDVNLSATAAPLIAVAAFFQLSDGVQAVGAGVLRGAGDTRYAFLANLVGHYAVGLPAAIFLCFTLGWGLVGLWWGLGAGLTAVAAALFTRFWLLSRRAMAPLETVRLRV